MSARRPTWEEAIQQALRQLLSLPDDHPVEIWKAERTSRFTGRKLYPIYAVAQGRTFWPVFTPERLRPSQIEAGALFFSFQEVRGLPDGATRFVTPADEKRHSGRTQSVQPADSKRGR